MSLRMRLPENIFQPPEDALLLFLLLLLLGRRRRHGNTSRRGLGTRSGRGLGSLDGGHFGTARFRRRGSAAGRGRLHGIPARDQRSPAAVQVADLQGLASGNKHFAVDLVARAVGSGQLTRVSVDIGGDDTVRRLEGMNVLVL